MTPCSFLCFVFTEMVIFEYGRNSFGNVPRNSFSMAPCSFLYFFFTEMVIFEYGRWERSSEFFLCLNSR